MKVGKDEKTGITVLLDKLDSKIFSRVSIKGFVRRWF